MHAYHTLKRNETFLWTQAAKEAFKVLKQALIFKPILTMPNFSKPFLFTIDVNSQAIDGVLSQEGKKIAYESRKLSYHELIYPTHDLEIFEMLYALKQWCHYQLGNTFKIK